MTIRRNVVSIQSVDVLALPEFAHLLLLLNLKFENLELCTLLHAWLVGARADDLEVALVSL